nr:MAG TPA: hypothetical protein [Caudoviricetes sp.]
MLAWAQKCALFFNANRQRLSAGGIFMLLECSIAN